MLQQGKGSEHPRSQRSQRARAHLLRHPRDMRDLTEGKERKKKSWFLPLARTGKEGTEKSSGKAGLMADKQQHL